MIEGHTVDDHEVGQVVLVRRVVPVPSHHVERREILRRMKTNETSWPQRPESEPFQIRKTGG